MNLEVSELMAGRPSLVSTFNEDVISTKLSLFRRAEPRLHGYGGHGDPG